jgi:hypothetical protein
MQAFRVNTPAQSVFFRGEKKKRKEKRGATACSKNLGIWIIKEMNFACFILP